MEEMQSLIEKYHLDKAATNHVITCSMTVQFHFRQVLKQTKTNMIGQVGSETEAQ